MASIEDIDELFVDVINECRSEIQAKLDERDEEKADEWRFATNEQGGNPEDEGLLTSIADLSEELKELVEYYKRLMTAYEALGKV